MKYCYSLLSIKKKQLASAIKLSFKSKRAFLSYFQYQEGELPVTGTGPLEIFGRGRLVLGQEIDNLQGGMSYHQSIHGDVADYQLFETVLDPSYLKEYASCGSPATDARPLLFFDESMTMFKVEGSANVSQVLLRNLCHIEEPNILFMLPEKLDFWSSHAACARMKGSMAVPTSSEMNKEIFDEIIRFNDDCVEAYGTIYWLGFKGVVSSGQWLTLEGNTTLTWDNLAPGYDTPEEDQACASVGGADFPLMWYSTPCEYAICPLCNFTKAPSFRVRGLCKDSLVDRSLFLWGYKNNKPHFQGPLYVSVFWDEENATWSISHRAAESLTAHMISDAANAYPTGIRTWTFTGDSCGVSQV